MSPVVESETRKSLLEKLSIIQIVIALAVSIGGATLSVWVTQARTTDRIDAVEKAQEKMVTRELLDERWKTVERIDKNVEKIRDALSEKGRRER
ncbi:MAG TPA: hypothetical protein VF735_08860 [Pyrinomonadaceae bacterium]|jgi:hypothetical protein